MVSKQLRDDIFAALENVSSKLSLVSNDDFESVLQIQGAVNNSQEIIAQLDRKASELPKAPAQIVLEDTGERRYPTGNDAYLSLGYMRDHGKTLAEAISCADNYDGEWGGKPEEYAIYRVKEVTE